MQFIKRFFINLFILIVIFLVVDFFMPGLIGALYQIGIGVLGPGLLLLLIIVIVLSRGRG